MTTPREVLNRLVSEGFVVAEGRRGFEIAPVSDGSLNDIANLRICIESYALEPGFHDGNFECDADVLAAHHRLKGTETRMRAGSCRQGNLEALWPGVLSSTLEN